MTPTSCRREMRRFLSGGMDPSERAAFMQHVDGCDACRGVVEVDALLTRLRDDVRAEATDREEPGLADGMVMRAAVLNNIRQQGRATASRPGTRPRAWLQRAMTAAAAVLIFVAGFGAHAFWSPDDESNAGLVRRIERLAAANRQLADVENSPYVLTNVTFRSLGDSRVALGFDVIRHVDVTADRSDPLVKEAVVQTMLNPSPIGSRLKAIDYAGDLRHREVKGALRIAMFHDPAVAVRLKALDALASYKQDAEVQSAFLDVLKTADSVQMRLLTIDYLIDSRIDPAAMRDALQNRDLAGHAAALVKAGPYIQ